MRLTLDQAFLTAIAHHQAGRWVEASQLYQQILAEYPNQPDALHLSGLLARRSGDDTLAIQLIQRAIIVRPDFPEYYNNLGISQMHLAQTMEAAASFRQAIVLAPAYPEAHNNLGNALRQLRDFPGAIAAFARTIELRPDLAAAHAQLGELLCNQGQLDAGMVSLRRSLQLAPDHVDVLMHLSNALAAKGDLSEAEAILRRTVEVRPDSSAGWTNLGNILRIQARPDDAINAYRQATQIDHNNAAAYCNMGNALKDQGLIDEAIVAFRKAVALDPNSPDMHSNLVYATCFSPDYDAAQLLAEAKAWAYRFETPLLATHRPFQIDLTPNRRLRIGYVSMDFRNHVVGRNVLPIIERHDRSRFEIHCFSIAPSPDAYTQRFINAAEHWHECASLDPASLAGKVRAEQIDILVDLSLHMAGHRLLTFAHKPAPVQVTWAGYPGTTGLGSIDYRLTDPFLDPPATGDKFYSEQSIRLPHSFWCYRPIDDVPEVNPLPAITTGHITFGCLNNFAKVTQHTLALWSKVLQQVRGSHLLLLCPSDGAKDRTRNYFFDQAIEADRIHFVGMNPPHEHMQRYHHIDICLDPTPYTGHTTTLDALWMGVPVITFAGNTSVARGSVTALSNVGLTGLIAHGSDQYIQSAISLACNLPCLRQLRDELRSRLQACPICDEARFAGDLEAAYERMWRQSDARA